MYRISAFSLDKQVLAERELDEAPTQRDMDNLIHEVGVDCFIDVCRIDPGFDEYVEFRQELEFDLVDSDNLEFCYE